MTDFNIEAVLAGAGGVRSFAYPGYEPPPVSDVSVGSWTTETGSSTNLYASISESGTSDADYVISSLLTLGASDTFEVAIDPLTLVPFVTGAAYQVTYRIAKVHAGGTGHLRVSLRQGASTEIATWFM